MLLGFDKSLNEALELSEINEAEEELDKLLGNI